MKKSGSGSVHVKSHIRAGKKVKAYTRNSGGKMGSTNKALIRAIANKQNNPLMSGFLHPITGNVRGLITAIRSDRFGQSHSKYGAKTGRAKELHDVDFRKLKSSYKFKKFNKYGKKAD